MKLRESVLKTVRCAYAYNFNGAVAFVLVHEVRKRGLSTEWATVHGSDIAARFAGRIVLHDRGILRAMLGAVAIEAKAATVERGSDNTRARGIAVGHVSLQLGADRYADMLHITVMPELISHGVTYQPDNDETMDPAAERASWAGYQVAA